jgi:CO/xanthine dehydrogenase FAD-binding subunit
MSGNALASPASLAEALDLLATGPWRPLAGGTDLMVGLAQRGPGAYLDLSGIAELRGIAREGDSLVLGAAATYRDLLDHPEVHRAFPNLVKSARATGAHAIQNRGTLGGNLANASPAADSVPSLLAYGAELELVSRRGSRTVPCEMFHVEYRKTLLEPDELIAWIHLPIPTGRTFHYFRKVGTRAAQAISKTCLALFAQVAEGRILQIRLGLGSVAPVPLRAKRAEAVLLGQSLSNIPVDAALEALQADISPIDDIRSNAHYRRVVTANLLREALGQLGSRA